MKKTLCIIAVSVISFALMALFAMGLLALAPKDQCLDQGGRYNELTKQCEKETN